LSRPPAGAVRLRAWRQDDLEALVEAMNDPEVVRRMVYPSPFTEQDGREALQLYSSAPGSFAVTDDDDGLLGAVWVRDVGEGRGQIGYWTRPHARGRGIGSEALRLLVPRGFGLGFARLQLLVDPENVGSVRVAENAGFRREGVLRGWMDLRDGRRDLIMYGLLAGDV
jgi:RimJ/RimL family protein N-acetyltransferase